MDRYWLSFGRSPSCPRIALEGDKESEAVAPATTGLLPLTNVRLPLVPVVPAPAPGHLLDRAPAPTPAIVLRQLQTERKTIIKEVNCPMIPMSKLFSAASRI